METAETICTFWFGTTTDDATTIAEQSALWWSKRDEVDAAIRARFEPLVIQAGDGHLDAWLHTPIGHLALILLTDQFPRNIYRNDARAFAFDERALGWSNAAISRGIDRRCRPIERVFFYLPLEHSENRDDQAEAVRLFEALATEVPPHVRPAFDGFADFARRHREIVDRFGRFPHRNAALGRVSTAEEAAFLRQPGSGF
ncbi:DUF924 domain-containing protein [Azoarcus sp. L1K30]|uniref:DUF924 family protein n=1 Tax=Azoarcus sp. L1K30 TaxID=2820277 RepID=UPI001B8411BC|nr:DUF924 family protein [Azoarcus sp. L1K30]MBR0567411.1 DUF924 domain-containing protein [Azoarcus sp. L1K30]